MSAFLGNTLGVVLKFTYDIVSKIGVEPKNFSYYAMAILITSVIFKLILLPLNIKQNRSTKQMNIIQPKMKEIQTKYKNDPQTMQIKMAELYKEHKYNPASSCIMLLVQLPIILAFFNVMRNPVMYAFKDQVAYDLMNKSFLWIDNLSVPDPILWGLPLIAGLTTYIQSATMPKTGTDPQAQAMQKNMAIFLPLMIFMSAKSFAAGLALYWIVGNIFTIIQQVVSNSIGKVKEEK